jgi:hypothetical protein
MIGLGVPEVIGVFLILRIAFFLLVLALPIYAIVKLTQIERRIGQLESRLGQSSSGRQGDAPG